MTIQDFLNRHQATAAHIHSAESLAGLLEDMKLGGIITHAWSAAAQEGLLPPAFSDAHWNLAQISGYLTDPERSPIPQHLGALEIARETVHRAAKSPRFSAPDRCFGYPAIVESLE